MNKMVMSQLPGSVVRPPQLKLVLPYSFKGSEALAESAPYQITDTADATAAASRVRLTEARIQRIVFGHAGKVAYRITAALAGPQGEATTHVFEAVHRPEKLSEAQSHGRAVIKESPLSSRTIAIQRQDSGAVLVQDDNPGLWSEVSEDHNPIHISGQGVYQHDRYSTSLLHAGSDEEAPLLTVRPEAPHLRLEHLGELPPERLQSANGRMEFASTILQALTGEPQLSSATVESVLSDLTRALANDQHVRVGGDGNIYRREGGVEYTLKPDGTVRKWPSRGMGYSRPEDFELQEGETQAFLADLQQARLSPTQRAAVDTNLRAAQQPGPSNVAV
jgi:hypothetical protein